MRLSSGISLAAQAGRVARAVETLLVRRRRSSATSLTPATLRTMPLARGRVRLVRQLVAGRGRADEREDAVGRSQQCQCRVTVRRACSDSSTASPSRICSAIAAASSETRSASTRGRSARAPDESASARARRIGLGLLGDEVLDREVGEQLHAVAAAPLGGGERAAGAVDEALDRAQRVAGAHRADRDGHGQQRLVVDRDRQRSDEAADLLGERCAASASSGTPGVSTMNASPSQRPSTS